LTALVRASFVGVAVSMLAVGLAIAGLSLVDDTVWSGAVSREGLRLAAFAAIAVGGGRLFLDRRSGRLAWAAGLIGATGLVWWGFPPT
jgi:hypothetical protein